MPAQRVLYLGQSRQAALWALRAVAALMSAAALTLLVRRLDGACGLAPSTLVFLAAGVAAVGVALGIRLAARRSAPAQRDRLPLEIAASGAVWLSAAAISAPGVAAWAVATLWLTVLAEEGWAWFAGRERPQAVLQQAVVESARPDEEAAELDEIMLPDGVCQQLTRSVVAGADVLSALVRVPFVQGSRTANAHVAFCPPFPVVPECEAEVVDGLECRVKIAQILPCGVRLECKLTEEAEESCDTIISVEARSWNA